MLPPPSSSERIAEGSITPSNGVAAAGEPFLHDGPTSDEAIDDHDDGDDEQDMDQPAPDVDYEEPKNPKNEEYYRDSPKHDGILARSELHLAR